MTSLTTAALLLASLVAASQDEYYSYHYEQVITSTPEGTLKPKAVTQQPKIRDKFLQLRQQKETPALTLEEPATQTGSPGTIERAPVLVASERPSEPAPDSAPPGFERQKTTYQEPPHLEPLLVRGKSWASEEEHPKPLARTKSVPTSGTSKEGRMHRARSAIPPIKREAGQHKKIRERFVAEEQGKEKEKLALPPISPRIAAFEKEVARQKKEAQAAKRHRVVSKVESK